MAVGGSIGGGGFNPSYPGMAEAEMGEYTPGGHPYLTHVMEGMPGTVQSFGTTAFRGSNTIMTGGWADRFNMGRKAGAGRFFGRRRAGPPEPMKVGGMFKNNNPFRPRNWTRYGSQEMFFKDAAYTPFSFAPGSINWAARKGHLGDMAKGWAGEEGAGGKVVTGGMFGQISAAERLGKMTSLGGDTAKFTGQYLGRAEQALGTPGLQAYGALGGAEARTATYMSMQGKLGQYAGGYLNALRSPAANISSELGAFTRTGSYMTEPLMRQGGVSVTRSFSTGTWGRGSKPVASEAFARGGAVAQEALMHLGGLSAEQIGGKIGVKAGYGAIKSALTKGGTEKLAFAAADKLAFGAGAKVAGALGARAALSAVPYVNIALWASMAYDLTKSLVPASAKFATDAYKSYKGWGSASFGGGYKTHEAAVTSRSRGVAAIQNSRLNARSVLGSEAGGMASYYG